MATNGWIGEQTVHSWGSYNSRLTTNVYINGIRRYSDHIDVSGVIYLFCKSSGARTVWYDWAITAWCGGGNLGQIKPRTYNNNILGKSWSKNFSIRINCSNSATSATFQVGFSDSNMGGKDKYWTLYFDRYATSPSGISSTATYTQYSTISTSCSGINWGQGYSSRSLTCTASYTYNGKTENFTLGTWTDGATSKTVTKSDFNFPADLNVTVKWTASTNIGSTFSTSQVRAKQTFPAPNLSNTTFIAESIAPYCIRVNVSGVDFGDNYSAQKLELYGTYELDGIIYDNKLGEISNQTSWTLEYDASQEAEPWTKIPDDSSILLRLVADNGNRTSDKTIIINCQSSYEAYVIEHISEEEKEKSETYTGKNIQIQNAPKDAPLADFKLKGNTSQQTYSGKNLYCVKTRTVNGITMTVNADGSFNLSGTATATVYMINETKPISLMENGATYTCWANSNIPSGVDVRLGIDNEGAWVRNLMSAMSGSTTTRTFTANTSGGDAIRCEIYVPNGTTVNISNMKIQLEAGSSATSFEPYVGGIPAPNPDYPQAVQTVTGENVVKICGKNLLKLTQQANTSSGITATLSNGVITYSGTASANWSNIASRTYDIIPSGTYMLSMQETFSSNYAYALAVTYTDGTTANFETWQSVGNKRTVTFTKDVASYYVYLTGLSSGTSYSGTISMMLEKNSDATNFEPYQDQSYEVNLGKNLFDIATASDVWINTSGISQPNDYWKNSDFIKVEPNTTYTLSGSTIEGGFPTLQFQYHEYSSDNESSYINQYRQINGVNSVTFTTHTGCNYIRVGYRLDALENIQFELGSQATSYAAYFEPIELCGLGDDGAGGYLYQDHIYKSDGKWYVRKEVGKAVLDGSEAWETPNNRSYSLYKSNSKISDMSLPAGTLQMLCDYFTPTQLYDEIGSVGTGNSFINFNYDGTSSNLAGFKTWLKNNNVSLYAPLSTPTDTEITNEALVAQLEAILSQGYTYAGTNNITTVISAGNEQGTLEIQHYTKWQNTSPAILSANGRNGTGNFKQIRRIGTK